MSSRCATNRELGFGSKRGKSSSAHQSKRRKSDSKESKFKKFSVLPNKGRMEGHSGESESEDHAEEMRAVEKSSNKTSKVQQDPQSRSESKSEDDSDNGMSVWTLRGGQRYPALWQFGGAETEAQGYNRFMLGGGRIAERGYEIRERTTKTTRRVEEVEETESESESEEEEVMAVVTKKGKKTSKK